jgi:hypothetical protein
MTDDIKHAKVTTYTSLPDGTVEIQTDSYYERPSGLKQEVMRHIKTNRDTFMTDLITCVEVVTSQKTPELTLVITTDNAGNPTLITQTYTTKKIVYPRR